jgi:hypothetical protein
LRLAGGLCACDARRARHLGIAVGIESFRSVIPKIENEGGETTLSGTPPDQSPLDGILNKVRDLGLSIITVRRLPPM